MSALQFEGIPVDSEIDNRYLNCMHALRLIGEVTPSEEAAGGYTIRMGDEIFTTRQTEGAEREKVLPTIYLRSNGSE